MYRYNAEVMELYRKIEAGELGEIYSVEHNRNKRVKSSDSTLLFYTPNSTR